MHERLTFSYTGIIDAYLIFLYHSIHFSTTKTGDEKRPPLASCLAIGHELAKAD